MLNILNSLSKSYHRNRSAALASNTPLWCLKRMLNNSSTEVQELVLRREDIPEDVLKELALSSHHHYVKWSVLSLIEDPVFLEEILTDDSKTYIQKIAVLRNPKLEPSSVDMTVDYFLSALESRTLKLSDDSSVESASIVKVNFTNMLTALLTSPHVSAEKANALLRKYVECSESVSIPEGAISYLSESTKLSADLIVQLAVRSSRWSRLVEDLDEGWFVELIYRFFREQDTEVEGLPSIYIRKLLENITEHLAPVS